MFEPPSLNTDFWRDRPVLVTGGTGFLGSWVVRRLLEAKAEVVCLVRHWTPQREVETRRTIDRVTVVRGDLSDQTVLEGALGEFEIRTVLHLAAQSSAAIAQRNPVGTFESNIGGTWRLLEACRRSPAVSQILIASSDKVYGSGNDDARVESAPLLARAPFDVSKACSDLIALSYAHTYAMPIAVTRSGNLFGGGDVNWNRIVPSTMRSLMRKQRPVIRSDGKAVRDFLYIEDSAFAHLYLAEQLAQREELAGEVFNLSSESHATVRQIVQSILDIAGMKMEPDVLGESMSESTQNILSIGKVQRLLGWAPQVPFDEALRRTYEWYREYFAEPQHGDILPLARSA